GKYAVTIPKGAVDPRQQVNCLVAYPTDVQWRQSVRSWIWFVSYSIRRLGGERRLEIGRSSMGIASTASNYLLDSRDWSSFSSSIICFGCKPTPGRIRRIFSTASSAKVHCPLTIKYAATNMALRP